MQKDRDIILLLTGSTFFAWRSMMMKKAWNFRAWIAAAGLALSTVATLGSAIPLLDIANSQLLPEALTLGVIGDSEQPGIVNHTGGGFLQAVELPTVNEFAEAPGCYLACYSRLADNSVYPIGDGIYVMGQFRVAGQYGLDQHSARTCVPKGQEGIAIDADAHLKAECTRLFPKACPDEACWVGGDTGGFFGIQ